MDELPKSYFGFDERADTCESHGAFTSCAVRIAEKVLHWSKCPACMALQRAESQAEEIARKVQERQKRVEARLNMSGIPLRYRGKDFASFTTESDKQKKALAVAMEFTSNFKQHAKIGSTMVFSGLPGTGKSHLAIAIGQEVKPIPCFTLARSMLCA